MLTSNDLLAITKVYILISIYVRLTLEKPCIKFASVLSAKILTKWIYNQSQWFCCHTFKLQLMLAA